ncbi:methyltransferase domain-containing protein [Ilyonectria destructans]|nr:methyltransferase domain-containing protein [Ilyonectria destructans]
MSHFDKTQSLSSVADARSLYDDWAASYEKEMTGDTHNYVAPAVASAYVIKCLNSPSIDENIEILDAGCGTGLVGTHLYKLGAKKIDGLDLSPGMLEIARKTEVYRSLEEADLSQRLSQRDSSYDVVVCVGTLTGGHVGPEALDEFVRITKVDGFVVATVRDTYWESGGYKAKATALAEEGKARIVNDDVDDYRPGAGVKARMLVLKVLA